ncbi:uncharacterized protein METZ01_LOCUS314812, partial [marine metagenome]
MLWSELLMPRLLGQYLCGLNKAAATLGVLFEIHNSILLSTYHTTLKKSLCSTPCREHLAVEAGSFYEATTAAHTHIEYGVAEAQHKTLFNWINMSRIAQIFRYPVKGLSPEPMSKVELKPGGCIPLDRAFALAHGSTEFNPMEPRFLPKTKFLMLAQNERLASLRSRYLEKSQELVIERDGQQVARGRLDQPIGRQMIEQFFAGYLGDEVRGSPKLLRAPRHTFSDMPRHCLSLINISSLRELERVVKAPIDPLRFRANLYFDTGTPWKEFDWCDKEFKIGCATVKGLVRTQR